MSVETLPPLPLLTSSSNGSIKRKSATITKGSSMSGSRLMSRHSSKPSAISARSASFVFERKKCAIHQVDHELDERENPFKLPSDFDIFTLREKQQKEKMEEFEKRKSQLVHEKMTKSWLQNARCKRLIKPLDDDEKDADDIAEDKALKQMKAELAITKERRIERESKTDFINKKREMFLIQYTLGVKRAEIIKLEELAETEEKKLELAEKHLEEDAILFDEFLKENDRNSVEAIRIAEEETRARMEKVFEIKRMTGQIASITGDISRLEETLKEYREYKSFLDSLAPDDWQNKSGKMASRRKKKKGKAESKKGQTLTVEPIKSPKLKRQMTRKSMQVGKIQLARPRSGMLGLASISSALSIRNRMSQPSAKSLTSTTNLSASKESKKSSSGLAGGGNSTGNSSDDDDYAAGSQYEDDDDVDEEVGVYFTDPSQLMKIYGDLEEQNLSLIQNSQETEETLEDVKRTLNNTRQRMENEIQALKELISVSDTIIEKERQKIEELHYRVNMFTGGKFKVEDQEKILNTLNKKVEGVYTACIGENEASIGTLQMLTAIENHLEEIFEVLEEMPREKVEAAKKEKEKERRLLLREEKLAAQADTQAERTRKALERAKAPSRKLTGRRLIFRSAPPLQRHQKERKHHLKMEREEEENAIFFFPCCSDAQRWIAQVDKQQQQEAHVEQQHTKELAQPS